MSIEKVILVFLYLLMQNYLDVGVIKLPIIDQFDEPKRTSNLVLIRDVANPMAMKSRRGDAI